MVLHSIMNAIILAQWSYSMFDPKTFTWGAELEWGDVDRRLTIPEHLGQWEYAETDIVNVNEPYWGRACDPLGIDPPFGGEINTKPTKTWQEQLDRIMEIYQFFIDNGNTPTASPVSHFHIHVFVPGLKENIVALKRMISYVKENQHELIKRVHQYKEHYLMNDTKTAKTYLKWDCGRPMPDYMCDNIINLATDFNHFIKLHCAGKDGVSMGRPFRYAFNTYCMKHTGTLEFRLFRDTVNREEMAQCLAFAQDFVDAAVNGGRTVEQIIADGNYKFPPMIFDRDLYLSWENSKYGKERGNKQRQFFEVA